jgi:hypothetical protein
MSSCGHLLSKKLRLSLEDVLPASDSLCCSPRLRIHGDRHAADCRPAAYPDEKAFATHFGQEVGRNCFSHNSHFHFALLYTSWLLRGRLGTLHSLG